MDADPATVPALVGVALTVTVTLEPLAMVPRSQVNSLPEPHDPWLVVMLSIISVESRFRATAAPVAWLGPLLVILATHEAAVPVAAVDGAVRVTERSAGGERERGPTGGGGRG